MIIRYIWFRFIDIIKLRNTEPVEFLLGFFTVFQTLWLAIPKVWHLPELERILHALLPFRWLLPILLIIGLVQICSVLLLNLRFRMIGGFISFILWTYTFLKFLFDGLWEAFPVSLVMTLAALWITWRLAGSWRKHPV